MVTCSMPVYLIKITSLIGHMAAVLIRMFEKIAVLLLLKHFCVRPDRLFPCSGFVPVSQLLTL